MARVKFVKDIYWLNQTSTVVDDGSLASSATNNLCRKINQTLGHIESQGFYDELYCRIEQTEDIPEKVRVVYDLFASVNCLITMSINGVQVFSKSLNSPETGTTTYTLSPAEVQTVKQSRNNIYYDMVLITFSGLSFGTKRINSLEVYYESDTGATYNNHETAVGSAIRYAHSTGMTTTNWTSYTNLARPTSSSANDATPITYVTENTSGSCLTLPFNVSGAFSTPTTIQRSFLNLRYSQSGTFPTARTDCFSAYATFTSGNTPFMWGKGFTIEPSSSGFQVGTVPMYFVRGSGADLYYNSSTSFSGFDMKFIGLPSGMKISAMELLLYEEPNTSIDMHTLCSVLTTVDNKYPASDSYNFTSGKNRFKSVNSSGIFDIGQWLFPPSGLTSDTGRTGGLSNSGVPYWDNYFNKRISSYSTHNGCYNNAMFLKNSYLTIPNINLSGDFSLLVQLSSSGNTYNYFGNTGNVLTKYNHLNEREFELNCLGNIFEFVVYNVSGAYVGFEMPATANSQLLIMNNSSGDYHVAVGAHSNGMNQFTTYGQIATNKARTAGNLVLFSGFYGYLHELSIASRNIGQNFFSDTRHNYHEYLRGSGIYIHVPTTSNYLNTDYALVMESAQVHNPYFNQFIGDPSGIYIDIDYENITNNPSGVSISGCYYNGASSTSNNYYFNFNKHLPSGSGTARLYAQNYVNNNPTSASGLDYDLMSFWLYGPQNSNYTNFKLKTVSITYEGWADNPVVTEDVDFHTSGEQLGFGSLNFFEYSKMGSSGVDFFVNGYSPTNSGVNFHTMSTATNTSGINLYTSASLNGYSMLNMSISGTTPTPLSSGLEFFQFATTNSSLIKTVPFTIDSEVDSPNIINFFTQNAKDNLLDSINFYIKSEAVYNKSVEMFMPNTLSGVDYSVPFYVQAAYSGLTGNINMGTK